MSDQAEYCEPLTAPDVVRARLKWFNHIKGFGFVVPEHEREDAFIHITALREARIEALGEGASLLCRVKRGLKGAHVSEIVEVLDPGVRPEPIDSPLADLELTGTLKFYSPEKGFGFIAADDGQTDVFLPRCCLKRHGLENIKERTPLVVKVRNTPTGRVAIDFEILRE